MIKRITLLSIATLLIFVNCGDKPVTMDQEDPPENQWELVWSDEFNYTGLPDSTKWSYDVGDSCDKPAGCGWGNNELQYYTENRSNNARVGNGKLTIEVHKEKFETRDYTSARLVSKGKGDWQYGRFETRAKLPKGKGVWSAIWMLPSEKRYKSWPHSGEIDILENVGFDPDSLIGTIHTLKYNHLKNTHKNGGVKLTDAQDTFHNYILEWDAEQLRFYVDELEIFRYDNEHSGSEAWPFDQPFHMILNIAYGGNWGGREGIDPESLPAQMEVDYVRVYQRIADKG